MLMFIRYPTCKIYSEMIVSIHPMLMFIKNQSQQNRKHSRFNTSHVNVYPECWFYRNGGVFSFNTSHVNVYHSFSTAATLPLTCFNTSHVNVYQITLMFSRNLLNCFNTSHVNVYQIPAVASCNTNNVSIHPMLMFIKVYIFTSILTCAFQYIPC